MTSARVAREASGANASANVAKSAGIQLISLFTTMIDRIVLTAILIREWGTDGFADWTTVISASGLVLIIELGFQQLVGNQLLQSHVKNRPNTFNHTFAWAMFTSLILGLVLVVAVTIVAVTVDLQNALGLRSDVFVPVLIIMCALSAVRIARGPFLQAYRGLAEFHNFIWADVRATLISTILAIIAVVLGAGAVFVAAIYLITTIVFSVFWTWRDLSQRFSFLLFEIRRPPWRVARQTLLQMRWYALFFALSNVMQAAPILIIATLGMPATLLATFAVQRTLVNFIRTTSFGISNAAGAELSVLKLSGRAQAFERGLMTLGRLNACLAAFAVVGLLMFGEHIVSIWTGRGDLGSSTLLALLLIPAIVVAPALGMQQASVMLDRIRAQALAYVLFAAIGLLGGIALAPHYGIVGIAAAIAIGETIAIGFFAPLWASRSLSISYWPIALRSLLVFVAVAGWAAVVAVAIENLPISTRGLARLIPPVLWATLAFPPAIWLCAPPSLRQAVLSRTRGVWHRVRA